MCQVVCGELEWSRRLRSASIDGRVRENSHLLQVVFIENRGHFEAELCPRSHHLHCELFSVLLFQQVPIFATSAFRYSSILHCLRVVVSCDEVCWSCLSCAGTWKRELSELLEGFVDKLERKEEGHQVDERKRVVGLPRFEGVTDELEF